MKSKQAIKIKMGLKKLTLSDSHLNDLKWFSQTSNQTMMITRMFRQIYVRFFLKTALLHVLAVFQETHSQYIPKSQKYFH